MMRSARLLLPISVLAVTVGAARSRDFLRDDVRDDGRYHVAIHRILRQGWRKDVVLRTLLIPPFSKEVAVGIRRDGREYRTFMIEPTSQIWLEASPENKHPDYSKIRSKYSERPLRSDIADRCIRLWYKVLSSAANYHHDEGILLDATQVYFFARLPPHKPLSAWARQWDEDGRTRALLDISAALTDYVDGTTTDAKFLQVLRIAEKQ